MESKEMPSAPPPYVQHPEGQHAPYGFTTNIGQPQGPYMHPPTGPPAYGAYNQQPGYPPQPGYMQPQPGYMPGQPATQMVPSVSHPGVTQPIDVRPQGNTVVVIGGCPTCRVGTLEDSFTLCGVLLAIIFFPIGILCCFAMKEKRCQNCNATF